MKEEGFNLAGSRRRYSFLTDIYKVGWMKFLNKSEINLLMYLIHKANWATRLAYPGYKRIYGATNIYRRRIQPIICRLCLYGIIAEVTKCISHGQQVNAFRISESVPLPDKERVKKVISEVSLIYRDTTKMKGCPYCELKGSLIETKGIPNIKIKPDTSLKITKDQCVTHTEQKPYNPDTPAEQKPYNLDTPENVFKHYTTLFESMRTKDLIKTALKVLPDFYHNSIRDQIYSKGPVDKNLFDKANSEYVREKSIPEHTFMSER